MAPRRFARPAIVGVTLVLGAVAAVLAAFNAGWLGTLVLGDAPREPLERHVLAPLQVAILDVGRPCPGERPPSAPVPMQAWRAWLDELGWTSRVVAGAATSDLTGVSLLVAPGAACLSAAEAGDLRAYVRAGGGLLATGALGVRDERGRRAGFGLLEELLGAEHLEGLPNERKGYVTFRDGSPLGAGLEGLSVDPPRQGRFLAVTGGPHPYWSDARLQPLDPSLPQSYQSAAVAASFGAGRVAWLGFEPLALASGSPDRRCRRLLANAAAWAAGMPLVSIAPWPPPHRSAVLLRANVAGRARNAAFVARALLDARVSGSFVVRDDSLDELAGLGTSLSRAGDLALAGHGPPEADAGLAPRLALEASRLRLRWRLGAWPGGVLAVGLGGAEAARAAAGLALGYYLVEGATGRVQPSVFRVAQRFGPLRREREPVGFGRVSADDLGLSPLGFAGLDAAWLRRRLDADFEITAAAGGLHILSFHTQALGAPERLDTLASLIDEWSTRGAWIAGPTELAAWSRARAGLELSVEATASDRLRLALRAAGGPTGWPVVLDVHPPAATRPELVAGSADCRIEPPGSAPPVHLLVHTGPAARVSACEVVFVR